MTPPLAWVDTICAYGLSQYSSAVNQFVLMFGLMMNKLDSWNRNTMESQYAELDRRCSEINAMYESDAQEELENIAK